MCILEGLQDLVAQSLSTRRSQVETFLGPFGVKSVQNDVISRLSTGELSTTPTTFTDDVEPWIVANCATCHSTFLIYDEFVSKADDALGRVRRGDMPRCTGSLICPSADRMIADDYAVLEAWVRRGKTL